MSASSMKKVLQAMCDILDRLASFVGQFSDVAENAVSVLAEAVGAINNQIEDAE